MAGPLRSTALRALKPVVFIAALVPILKIGTDALRGGGLGADPIAEVLNRLGYWTLLILTASLACTPLCILLRIKWPLRVRRMLGLFAFSYGLLHFLFYLGVDQFFDMRAVFADIAKRKFILVGFSALVVLSILAATSTKRAVRKMGYAKWKRLHRLVYAGASLGVIHFLWRVKADRREPLTFAAIIAALLMVRVVAWALRRARGSGPLRRGAALRAPAAREGRSAPTRSA